MSESRKQPDRWLRRQLRYVPLPEGLLERLKQIAGGSDAELDAALGDVRLPRGLLSRLKNMPTDAVTDQQLRRVPVPTNLTAKLREIAAFSDVEIDRELSDVAVPPDWLARLKSNRQVARRWVRAFRQVPDWVVAASLLISIGLATLVSMTALVRDVYLADSVEPIEALDSGASALAYEPEQVAVEPLVFAEAEAPSIAALDLQIVSPFGPQRPRRRAGPMEEIARLFERDDIDPMTEVFAPDVDLVGKPAATAMPPLQSVRGPSPRGIAAPRSKDFDLLQLIREGVHPFVELDDEARLETSRVPLITSTDSYDATWSRLSRGELPPPEQVRVEHFLASLEQQFLPPVDEALGIRTAAGPSPFGRVGPRSDEDLCLLQVAVQAGDILLLDREPVHTTLLVDVSASMAQENKWDHVRRAVGRLMRTMHAGDRLSLVACSRQAELLIDAAAEHELPSMLAKLESLRPGGPTNLGAGLQLAGYAATRALPGARRKRRIVVVTDGDGERSSDLAARLELLASDVAVRGAHLDIIDLRMSQRDDLLAKLADNGGGRRFVAGDADAVYRTLAELVSGRSALMAQAASLKVRFNPGAVKRYRLLGHEADTLGGLAAGPLEFDLLAGQAASALYELELKRSADDEVAQVELAWKDPASGRRRVVRQRISRLQVATSIWESPVSLQRAAVAAEAAEVLRESKFAPQTAAGLEFVLQHVAELPPHVRDDAAFARLVRLVEFALLAEQGKVLPPPDDPIWQRGAGR